ncbi:cyclohexanecarboxylate-CoA ligase [Pseudonocardia yunnanensis]|uniref:AMP-binding protein n=1 Tax=Pseudonocardia yunnanensis TaxID=58107 RepID=A0ABW4ESX0_9PSEU
MSVFLIRPSDAAARKYHAAGVWRDSGPVGDLRRWRRESPDAVAIKAYRAGATPSEMSSVEIDYADFAHYVERFAGALYEMGVRPGHVVAFQLPNWWQAAALFLAATRLQAVLAPVMTTIRPRELERMLARVGANVCITVDEWAGFDHAAALREMAPRLPELRHRVVIGKVDDGETDFGSFFENTPWEQRHPVALDDAVEDPDRVAVLFFTSGTSGEPKGALHSENTVHAGTAGLGELGVGPRDVIFTPHALMHTLAYRATLLSLLNGACRVLLDSWSGERAAAVLDETGTTIMYAGPTFFQDLIAARNDRPQHLPAIRTLVCAGTAIPRPLVSEVPRAFGVPLRAGWGMTEVGLLTLTREDDPPEWAAHSDGRPARAVEVDLRSDAEITRDRPGRAFVRGGGVCLATVGRDTGKLVVIADQSDGWYDTGDLAVPDGRGGFKLMGRAADRIGGLFMIPAHDVESGLLEHPGVTDVALVGYPDDDAGELACAVVVPATSPPVTLDELRKYLSDQGMTEWYLPSRLELVATLPRNNGKVRKELLRRWVRGEAALAD